MGVDGVELNLASEDVARMHSITDLTFLTFALVHLEVTIAQPSSTYGSIRPVLAENFPDPALVVDYDTYYAFSTSGNGLNIQAAASADFIDHEWRLLGKDIDVFPDPGVWAINDQRVWAPDVVQLENGRWVMYYAAPPVLDDTKHCIGAATSNGILGPYTPADESFACPLDEGGAIDPEAFIDPKSGKMYVLYKIDGNSLNIEGAACGDKPRNGHYHPTPIMLQEVSKDNGITKIGAPVTILDRTEADGPLVEAPSLTYNQDTELYFLTFSSNCYNTDLYDVSFAYSTCLDQMFRRSKKLLMTTSSTALIGPGGADMTADGRYALYHATVGWDEKREPIRHMFAVNTTQAGLEMIAIPVF